MALSALQGLEPFTSSIVPSANLKMSFLRHLVGHKLWAESEKILQLLDVAVCFTSLLSCSCYFHSSQLNWVKTPWAIPDVTRSSQTCVSWSENGGFEDAVKVFQPTSRKSAQGPKIMDFWWFCPFRESWVKPKKSHVDSLHKMVVEVNKHWNKEEYLWCIYETQARKGVSPLPVLGINSVVLHIFKWKIESFHLLVIVEIVFLKWSCVITNTFHR